MTERPTEQTYASDLKEWINQIVRENGLPFSQAKVEIIKDKKRADILLYDRKNNCILVIEVKRPHEMPSDPEVVKQAYGYAEEYKKIGLRNFATHNVNILILYDAVTKQKTSQFSVTYVRELDEYPRKKNEIIDSFRKILSWYAKFLEGEPPKPLDESTIEILHSHIRGIVSSTGLVNEQINHYIKDEDYRKKFKIWLVDKGWEDPKGNKQKLEEYAVILVKQFLYIYINKILFYNVLKEKYPRELAKLTLPKDASSLNLMPFLETYFKIATVASQDYETVFQTNFVDNIPVSDDATSELVKLADYLNTQDYANIKHDIIGKVFEKLIPENERHKLGQYFTRSDVVDIILSFCVKNPDSTILDPACGSGTFLVRAYYRLRYLNDTKTHSKLLRQLWGIDIDKFPAHLATINLAIRELSAKENYPNIVYRDFFDISGPKTSIRIGMQPTLTSWIGKELRPIVPVQGLDAKALEREIPIMNCVVGNPPYTRQEEMGIEVFGENYKQKLTKVVKSDFPSINLPMRASIYAYFFPHGAKFLQVGSRLGFVCLRSWLDTRYGSKLQEFFLEHFKVIAVIEPEEKWFEEAQMLPCITILEVCNDLEQRDNHLVKFVRLKVPLSEFVPTITDERDKVQEIYRWEQTDHFTDIVEKASDMPQAKSLDFLGKQIRFYDDEKMRVISVKQCFLKDDFKWGKYMQAPSIFFRIIERGVPYMVPLHPILADVRDGVKTGANEFFTFPNKYFKIRKNKEMYQIIERATGDILFHIEREYLYPVFIKIKPQRYLRLTVPDGLLLMVHDTEQELQRKGRKVLQYIRYGKSKDIIGTRGRFKGVRIVGYDHLPTCKNRKPWYDLGRRKKSLIIFPSIFWGRCVVFLNDVLKGYSTAGTLFEIHPHNPKEAKILCALLNSTLTAFMVEFSGRYIENRDKTISNQIKVYEIQNLHLINPTKLSSTIKNALETAFDKLAEKEIGLRALYDPKDMADKEELDKIVFCDILGFSENEMEEAREALAEIVRRRIERQA